MDNPSARRRVISEWDRLADFAAIVERTGLHGLHFQHVALCDRRAWLHLRRIDYAHLDERMALGLVLHDQSRARDQSVEGLGGLMPDRIDWADAIVFEAKGGSGAVEAVSDQTAFYAVLLTAASDREWAAATHLLRQKRVRFVMIDFARLDRLWHAAQRLAVLADQAMPPPALRLNICESCSYRALCW